MPIPPFESSGLLPQGVYNCTLDEIKSRFGAFQGSDRRPKLFARIEAFVAEARRSRVVLALVVDGSFVTAKRVPNDVDIIVIVSPDHDFTLDLTPVACNVVSKKRVRTRFGFDSIAVREGTSELDDAVAFFQQVRGEQSLRKGVLRVGL